MMKKALITGITGQDGTYLAQFLLAKGYEVHGTSRSPSQEKSANLRLLGLLDKVQIYKADMASFEEVSKVFDVVKPDEVYHLAGQSSVAFSFQEPGNTLQSILQGTVNLLETIRLYHPKTRFYHSASSEMFGGDIERPYSETDLFHPRSPYAVGKAAAHWAIVNYRETYDVYGCSSILFNHESLLRSERFVTRKIAATVARIKAGIADKLVLGDLSIKRDWGYAPEYVEAMWQMLQQNVPEDYVIATGEAHGLREFVEMAFDEAGLDWHKYVITDPAFFRPNEVRCSVGNPSKANNRLGWKARTRFYELVKLMVRHDLTLVQ